MSLKAFHVVFIVASVLLSFAFAAWEAVAYANHRGVADLIMAVLSFVMGLALVRYGRFMLKKLKHISYL